MDTNFKNNIISKKNQFNWRFYLKMNPDLKRLKIYNKFSAWKHVISKGYTENRIIFKDTNILIYQFPKDTDLFRIIKGINFCLHLTKNNDLVVYVLQETNPENYIEKSITIPDNIKVIHDWTDISRGMIYDIPIQDNQTIIGPDYRFNKVNTYKQIYLYHANNEIDNAPYIFDLSFINHQINITNLIDKYHDTKNIFILTNNPTYSNLEYYNNHIEYYDKYRQLTRNSINLGYHDLEFNAMLLQQVKTTPNALVILDYYDHFYIKFLKNNKINYVDDFVNREKPNYQQIDFIRFLTLKIPHCHKVYYSGFDTKTRILREIFPSDKFVELDLTNDNLSSIYLESSFIDDRSKPLLTEQLKSKNMILIDSESESDIVLVTNSKQNKNSLMKIDIFNQLVTKFPYLIALEMYLDLNLEINDKIIKPIDSIWNYPDSTEYHAYLELRFLDCSKPYLAIGWEKIIDILIRGHNSWQNQVITNSELNKLFTRNKYPESFTVIESPKWRKLLPLLEWIGVKWVFSTLCQEMERSGALTIYPYFTFSFVDGKTSQAHDPISYCSSNKLTRREYFSLKKIPSMVLERGSSFNHNINYYYISHDYLDDNFIKNTREVKSNRITHLEKSLFYFCLVKNESLKILFESIKIGLVPIIDFRFTLESNIINLEKYYIKLDFKKLFTYLQKNRNLEEFRIGNDKLFDLIRQKSSLIRQDTRLLNRELILAKHLVSVVSLERNVEQSKRVSKQSKRVSDQSIDLDIDKSAKLYIDEIARKLEKSFQEKLNNSMTNHNTEVIELYQKKEIYYVNKLEELESKINDLKQHIDEFTREDNCNRSLSTPSYDDESWENELDKSILEEIIEPD